MTRGSRPYRIAVTIRTARLDADPVPSLLLRLCLLLSLLPLVVTSPLPAQVPGGERDEEGAGPPMSEDTLFIFTPARPLIDSSGIRTDLPAALGGTISFSGSGYGAGLFYERTVTPTLSLLVDLLITGVRKGDELEVYNNNPESVHYRSFFVPGKINRIWQAPIMLGVKKELFRDVFFDNFRPFVSLGAGLSTLLLTPYDQGFFSAFGSASWRFAPAGFVGLGAEVTGIDPGPGLALRYYYIPIDPGVESMQGEPITNLGGLVLSLAVPF